MSEIPRRRAPGGTRPPYDRGGGGPNRPPTRNNAARGPNDRRPPPGADRRPASPSGALRPAAPASAERRPVPGRPVPGPDRRPPSGARGGAVRSNRKPPPRSATPVIRRGVVRISYEVASRIHAGHPWIYREALGGRPLPQVLGDILELVDPEGAFVARGVYEPESTLSVRVVSRHPDEEFGPGLVRTRVRDAVALRRRLGPKDSDAVRLVNAESDGLPGVVVESWAGHLVVMLYTPAVMGWRDAIYDALEAEVSPRSIYEQRRFRPIGGEPATRGPAELVRGSAAPIEVEVTEGPLRFGVDPTAPVSTGLFLELRDGRRAIAGWAEGRRVLNLFSYTGAITAWAKRGGAREVVAVDAVAKGHARSRVNLGLSGFDPESVEHVTADVMKTLERFADRGRRFDLVVLDPPAFGTAGKGKVWAADKELRDLVAASLTVLDKDGILAATSSTHKISHDDFDRALAEGAARASTRLAILDRKFLPSDFAVAPGFPEGNTLKFAIAARS